jgi:spermidine synthase
VRRLSAALFFMAAATLLLELSLTRIFDVVLWSNLAFLFVSSALFGFGMGGVLLIRWPMAKSGTETVVAAAAAAFSFFVLLLIPAIVYSPALSFLEQSRALQIAALVMLYFFILMPFIASGMLTAVVVTRGARRIHALYFWDLAGAGIGCLGVFVLPQLVGGGETLLVVAAIGLLAVCVAGPTWRWWSVASLVFAAGLVAFAAARPNTIKFKGLVSSKPGNPPVPEFSRWDPAAKIDVNPQANPDFKEIVYDQGAQRTHLIAFNGDIAALRRNYFDTAQYRSRYNSGKFVALSHWLKQDRSARTLVIGSAGGQETLAALAWGAEHVDAVEMVCTVVDLVSGPYSAYIGRIFRDPRVSVTCDEGRSFLRRSGRSYDVIQILSNHTLSSLANGSGGFAPNYLETVEAYRDYFSHLQPDGVLQINYLAYPRMITTAAKAWSELYPGRDFSRHLVITSGYHLGETFLVRKSAWTPAAVDSIRTFLGPAFTDTRPYSIVYAPEQPESRNVPDEFFQVPLNARFVAALPYRVDPPSDDKPFFRDLRKGISRLRVDGQNMVPESVVDLLNSSLKGFVPLESVHVFGLGGLAVVMAGLFLWIPLASIPIMATPRRTRLLTLAYFGCLGAGFVIVELVMIFKFMLLIGHPITSMATVLFTLLTSAAIGSFLAEVLQRRRGGGVVLLAVAGLVAALGLLLTVLPALEQTALGLPLFGRVAVVAALVAPIGALLGMPFPLGINTLSSRAPQLIPWAWAINAFMTVVGSLLTVVLSLHFGFSLTLLSALVFYIVALFSLRSLEAGLRPLDTGGDASGA